YPLRHEIPRGCLPRKDEGPGPHVICWILFDTVIQCNYVEHIEMLALILVDTFDQNVKHGGWVNFNTGAFADESGKIFLVVGLHPAPGLSKGAVVNKLLELPEFIRLADPCPTDFLRNEPAQSGIAQQHEAAQCDPIGLIAEFLGHHFVEVTQDFFLEQPRVKFSHPVDGMASDAGQMSHADVPSPRFVDEGHPGYSRLIAWIFVPDLIEKTAVDFVDDLHMPGEEASEEVNGPLL